ncbi:hypothetical protein QJS04_geneDACA019372 [Acorus gramineus]|uniref:Jacalin-type lectin domain-containing protein n=1 Tax=Acorus gramineus TaxID=55184 RepID=A0AAV9ATU7_ACOGR|nr:hypothetical protein QJS04_geneDACA019372 [Acorus gramineus]
MPVKVGPLGGTGGDAFDHKEATGVREIIVVYGAAIDSITLKYDYNGTSRTNKIGGNGGTITKKVIVLDYPDEFLTGIDGYYKTHRKPLVIVSLTFYSNKSKYGPFGRQEGTFFSIPTLGAEIIGFFGRSGRLVDAIGVYLRTDPNVPPCTRQDYAIQHLACGEDKEVPCTALNALPCKVGLFGSPGGRQWDDGVCSGIKQIIIKRGNFEIHSIQIEYEKNGNSIWSPVHGGSGGEVTNRIKLDIPNEWVTCITGFYGEITGHGGFEVIKSLTFYTNKGKYGPLGKEIGKFFTTAGAPGKVVHWACPTNHPHAAH